MNILAAICHIKTLQQIQLTGSASPAEQKMALKFKKYLLRMSQVLEGTCKKIPSTPDNMFKIAMETQNHKDEIAEIIMNINVFEFEDRKHVQQILTELYTQLTEVLEETLNHRKDEVVTTLVNKYELAGLSTFIGALLRLYTKSNKLVDAFLNLEILEKLTMLITNPDFNI
jgi:hypothetical protein